MKNEYEADSGLPADGVEAHDSAGPGPVLDPPDGTGPDPSRDVSPVDRGVPSGDSRSLAAIAHLSSFVAFAGVPSFIGPLAVWLLQKDRDPFVAGEAREALNFNLSLLLYVAVAIVAMIFTLGLGLIIIIPVALVAAPAWLVVTALAAARAADGQPFHYPATIRMIA